MSFYRKKPVIIEAIQWDGTNLKEVTQFLGIHPEKSKWYDTFQDYVDHIKRKGDSFHIFSIKGNMTTNLGDYVIKGLDGEFYPCNPDVFQKTYETV